MNPEKMWHDWIENNPSAIGHFVIPSELVNMLKTQTYYLDGDRGSVL